VNHEPEVVVVTPYCDLSKMTGARLYFKSILSSLLQVYPKITVLCADSFDTSKLPPEVAGAQIDMGTPTSKAARLAFYGRNFPVGPLSIRKFGGRWTPHKIEEAIAGRNVKGIVTNHLNGLYMSQSAAKNLDLPIVHLTHNVECEVWQSFVDGCKPPKKQLAMMEARRMKAIEHRLLDTPKALVHISQEDLELSDKIYGTHPGIVFPPSAEEDMEQPITPAPKGKLKVGMIASYQWFPNKQALVQFLDEVLPAIRAANVPAEFLIAGRGAEDMEGKMSAKGVCYVGYVESAKQFLDDCNVVLVPTFSGGGVKLKTITAMARGRALLSTEHGIRGTFLEDEKDVLVADTPTEVAGALQRLSDDEALRDELGRAARERYDNTFGEHARLQAAREIMSYFEVATR
jgi:glycosyltransferase involved in cell wall biosynthesis